MNAPALYINCNFFFEMTTKIFGLIEISDCYQTETITWLPILNPICDQQHLAHFIEIPNLRLPLCLWVRRADPLQTRQKRLKWPITQNQLRRDPITQPQWPQNNHPRYTSWECFQVYKISRQHPVSEMIEVRSWRYLGPAARRHGSIPHTSVGR